MDGPLGPGADPKFLKVRMEARPSRRTLAVAGGAAGAGGKGPGGGGQKKKKKKLKCPRCGENEFGDVRELGKHAIKCKAGDGKNGKQKPGLPILASNNRMVQLMQIKKKQLQHDVTVKEKDAQALADREMELLIKMEQARSKRDEQEAAVKAQQQELTQAQEKEAAEKRALTQQLEARAEAIMGDSSDSDSEEDEEAVQRRKVLAAKLLGQGAAASTASAEKEPKVEPAAKAASEDHEDDGEKGGGGDGEEEMDWLSSPEEGYTACHLASYYNDVQSLGKIIELGGDLVALDPDGRNAAHICALYGHDECLERLLVALGELAPPTPGDSDDDQGEKEKRLTALAESLRHLADGLTPLAMAAGVGNFAAVAMLADADPGSLSCCDGNGDAPLHHAVFYGFADCATMLLQLGADPDGPPNALGKTPAAVCSSADVMETLVEFGADYYGIDATSGRSVLFSACANNYVDVVRYLLSLGDIDECLQYADHRGDTPLHAAACNGHAEGVAILLEAGVDPSVENFAGLTAATLAHCLEHAACLESFANAGVHAQALPDDDEDAWKEFEDKATGCVYYHHPKIGSTWNKPASLRSSSAVSLSPQ